MLESIIDRAASTLMAVVVVVVVGSVGAVAVAAAVFAWRTALA